MKKDILAPYFIFLLSVFIFSSSQAEMYKWVDDDGVTQYTQTPPPDGVEGETIKPRVDIPSSESEKKYKQVKQQLDSLLEEGRSEKEADEQGESVSDVEYQQQLKSACESAKKSYQSFQRPRVNLKNADGSSRVATEEERQAGLKKAQDAIKKYCK